MKKILVVTVILMLVLATSALANFTVTKQFNPFADTETQQGTSTHPEYADKTGNTYTSAYVEQTTAGINQDHAYFTFDGDMIKSMLDYYYPQGYTITGVTFNATTFTGTAGNSFTFSGKIDAFYNGLLTTQAANDSLTWNIEHGTSGTPLINYVAANVLADTENITKPGNGLSTLCTWNVGGSSDLMNSLLNNQPFSICIAPHASNDLGGSIVLDTREYTNAAARPYLSFTLDVVPEPASLLAMFTGMIGLAGFAIRRRQS